MYVSLSFSFCIYFCFLLNEPDEPDSGGIDPEKYKHRHLKSSITRRDLIRNWLDNGYPAFHIRYPDKEDFSLLVTRKIMQNTASVTLPGWFWAPHQMKLSSYCDESERKLNGNKQGKTVYIGAK